MTTYKQLQKEFDKAVKQLQKECPHNKSTWMEKWWAIGHSAGYSVRICNKCKKELEQNPSKKEDKKQNKKG